MRLQVKKLILAAIEPDGLSKAKREGVVAGAESVWG